MNEFERSVFDGVVGVNIFLEWDYDRMGREELEISEMDYFRMNFVFKGSVGIGFGGEGLEKWVLFVCFLRWGNNYMFVCRREWFRRERNSGDVWILVKFRGWWGKVEGVNGIEVWFVY